MNVVVLWLILVRGALGARVVFFIGDESEKLPVFLGLPGASPGVYEDICRSGNCSFEVLVAPADAQECIRVAGDADVVIAPAHLITVNRHLNNTEEELGRFFPPRRPGFAKRPLRAVYWREATWGSQLSPEIQEKWVDLHMGIQVSSHLVNPSFFPSDEEILETPRYSAVVQRNSTARTLLRPFRERADRALLVTSHCNVRPRQSYVDELTKYFRVDQYGACAENDPSYNTSENFAGPLPPKGDRSRRWNAQLDMASKYKFYISFENSVQKGYVTEKLLTTPLLAGVVPIYLGAPDVRYLPSIDGTGIPWYIDAFDYDTPEALAAYLRRLSKDENLWWNYLSYWDRAPKNPKTGLPTFFPDAPRNIQEARMPISDKTLALRTDKHDFYFPSRTFALCQLCDLEGLDERIDSMPLKATSPLWHAEKGLLHCLFKEGCYCKYRCVDSGPADAF